MHYLVTRSDQVAELKTFLSPIKKISKQLGSALKERYRFDRAPASNYFEELIKPISVPKKPSQQYLQAIITKVFGRQKINRDWHSDILLYIIAIGQLDLIITRKEYEVENPNSISAFASLMNFVKHHIPDDRLEEYELVTYSCIVPCYLQFNSVFLHFTSRFN